MAIPNTKISRDSSAAEAKLQSDGDGGNKQIRIWGWEGARIEQAWKTLDPFPGWDGRGTGGRRLGEHRKAPTRAEAPIPVEFQLEFSTRMLLGVLWAPWNGRSNPSNSCHPSKSMETPKTPQIPSRVGCQESFSNPRVAGKSRGEGCRSHWVLGEAITAPARLETGAGNL